MIDKVIETSEKLRELMKLIINSDASEEQKKEMGSAVHSLAILSGIAWGKACGYKEVLTQMGIEAD
jgi:hypothetical protein